MDCASRPSPTSPKARFMASSGRSTNTVMSPKTTSPVSYTHLLPLLQALALIERGQQKMPVSSECAIEALGYDKMCIRDRYRAARRARPDRRG